MSVAWSDGVTVFDLCISERVFASQAMDIQSCIITTIAMLR